MDEMDPFIVDLLESAGRGRIGKEDSAAYVRDIQPSDLLALQAPQEIKPLPIKQMRSSHHYLARLLAEGRKPQECVLITGYSNSRISILQQDPTFQELVQYYKDQVQEAYVNVHERLAQLGVASLEELQERLEHDPSQFKTAELLELAKATLDRAGYGPKSTSNVNIRSVVMTADELARIKADADARRSGGLRTLQEGGEVIDSYPGPGTRALTRAGQGGESERDSVREEILQVPEEERAT